MMMTPFVAVVLSLVLAGLVAGTEADAGGGAEKKETDTSSKKKKDPFVRFTKHPPITPLPNEVPILNEDSEHFEKGYSRLVVIGDLHGDLRQALRCMLEAGVISLQPNYYADLAAGDVVETDTEGHPLSHKVAKSNYINSNMVYNPRAGLMLGSSPDGYHWAGGKTLVVCTGDAMNVGPQDIAILRFVMRLTREAKAAGGHFEFLLGNHEMRNLHGDFDDTHPWSFEQSGGAAGRRRMLSTRSDLGSFLRHRKVLFVWNKWIFVHGGLFPSAVDRFQELITPFNPSTFVDEVNAAVTKVLTCPHRDLDDLPEKIKKIAEVFTNTDYETNGALNPLLARPLHNCSLVRRTLKKLKGVARAQFVGHTSHELPQFDFCDGQLFAIDFGNSQWKTGQGVAVATLLLGPPSDKERLEYIAKQGSVDVYHNKKTLGRWRAVLSISHGGSFLFPSEAHILQERIRYYQVLLVVLLLILAVVGYRLHRQSRRLRGVQLMSSSTDSSHGNSPPSNYGATSST